MSAIRLIKFAILVVLLSACGAKFEPPNLAKFSEKVFEITSQDSSSVLYIAHSDKEYNFTMISALGAPLARRVLTKGGKFKNIGFLPPNSLYNDLFIATLKMIEAKEDEKEILIGKEKFKVKKIDIR